MCGDLPTRTPEGRSWPPRANGKQASTQASKRASKQKLRSRPPSDATRPRVLRWQPAGTRGGLQPRPGVTTTGAYEKGPSGGAQSNPDEDPEGSRRLHLSAGASRWLRPWPGGSRRPQPQAPERTARSELQKRTAPPHTEFPKKSNAPARRGREGTHRRALATSGSRWAAPEIPPASRGPPRDPITRTWPVPHHSPGRASGRVHPRSGTCPLLLLASDPRITPLSLLAGRPVNPVGPLRDGALNPTGTGGL